ncbi:MAG: MerR family transcriptional regulator [Ruminiclostridium sp.]|nr:MerR family transcriptional regulator [Ruminiclostridium sp.]
MSNDKKLIRIRELADATGVSIQTIHYYLREGLLPPPTKTSPNMAYYNPEYIDDIRLIKELKGKRYLPLSVIRLVLDAKRRGKQVNDIQDMKLTLEDIFRPVGRSEEIEPVNLMEVVVMTGLPVETLEVLSKMGILMPVATTEGEHYDGLDVNIACNVKKLLDLGLAVADLEFFKVYAGALLQGMQIIREKVFRSGDISHADACNQVKEILDYIKAALDTKIYRKVAMEITLPGYD